MSDDLAVGIEELISVQSNRVPVVLCLDASASMTGAPMRELNEGIRLFINSVKEDSVASSSVELCVVTFADDARVISDFRLLANLQFDQLNSTGGRTNLGGGVMMALDLLEQRKEHYKKVGVEYYQPWMVLMTDGCPNVGTHFDAADRAIRLEADRKLVVFPIGIGNDADMNELAKFSKRHSPLKLKGLNFCQFFDWLSKSVSRVSQSMPGEKVTLDTDGIKGWGEA
ncbi:MAG: VWA domain-containing protein [Planctomycetaceae bacterium]|jgi:uncharacterized protein YegL|nr:VWA domain-containing protein [Planctomycetaceae bacterium]